MAGKGFPDDEEEEILTSDDDMKQEARRKSEAADKLIIPITSPASQDGWMSAGGQRLSLDQEDESPD